MGFFKLNFLVKETMFSTCDMVFYTLFRTKMVPNIFSFKKL
jgi:hypothetical protein